jgi:hypothetical protein
MDITKEFVSKFYRMDPEVDKIVLDGTGLKVGMVVLIESSNLRAKLEDTKDDWAFDRALEMNRWCTVSNIKIRGNTVTFVGKYEDGTMRVRRIPLDQSWLVKINSITDYEDKHTRVKFWIKGAINGSRNLDEEMIDYIVEGTTKNILDII